MCDNEACERMYNFRGSEHMAGGGAERRRQLKIVTKGTRTPAKQKTNQLAPRRGRGHDAGEGPGKGGQMPSL